VGFNPGFKTQEKEYDIKTQDVEKERPLKKVLDFNLADQPKNNDSGERAGHQELAEDVGEYIFHADGIGALEQVVFKSGKFVFNQPPDVGCEQ